jgi:hypothetical protein
VLWLEPPLEVPEEEPDEDPPCCCRRMLVEPLVPVEPPLFISVRLRVETEPVASGADER